MIAHRVHLLILGVVISLAPSGLVSAKATKTGFAITDLTALRTGKLSVSGQDFTAKSDAKRLTLLCHTCRDFTAIDVLLDKSTDGTEGRLRSGETKIAAIELKCRQREPNCLIRATKIRGAVGWVSKTTAAGSPTSTTILFKDGDRLVVRSIAGTIEDAYRNGQQVVDRIGTRIIG